MHFQCVISKESLLSPFWTPPQKMPDFDEAQFVLLWPFPISSKSIWDVCSCLHFGQNERILHQNRVEKFFSNSFTQKSDSFWVISRHMCEDLEQSKQHHTCVCFAKTIKLSFPPLFLGESRAWKMRISDVWVGEKWSKWLVFRDIHSSFCSTRR